jgi:hypothetical protein
MTFLMQMFLRRALTILQDNPQLVEKWDKQVWGPEWSESDTTEFLNGTER